MIRKVKLVATPDPVTDDRRPHNSLQPSHSRGSTVVIYLKGLILILFRCNVAEEAGVEPTKRVLHASPVLKTGPPTGEVSLPKIDISLAQYYQWIYENNCSDFFSR